MSEKKLQYQNLKEYLNFIRNNLKRVGKPKVGGWYSFNYFFHTNPDFQKVKPELKKTYDFFPCDLCISISPKSKSMMCINFHRLPVKTRQIFIARLKKAFGEHKFEKDPIKLPGVNYKKLCRYLLKLGVTIRRYRFSRIKDLREINPDAMEDIMKFYSNTYYRSNIKGIQALYNNYRPASR
jgi:hypothetical protein